MFSKRHQFRVFAFIMSGVLALLMTGLVTFLNTGLDPGYMRRWGRAFAIAWPIALTIVLIFGPHARTLADRLCSRDTVS
jgi:hypothetical protein